MAEHPYLPGTVWAPKSGNGRHRWVVQVIDGGTNLGRRSPWYVLYRHGPSIAFPPKQIEYGSWRRWAGEQVKGAP